MTKYMRTGMMTIAVLLGTTCLATGQASAQQAAAQQPLPQPGVCPAPGAGRGAGRGAVAGAPAAPRPKRVLAWADSRNGRSQHEYVSYALAQIQKMGRESKLYDVIIRTDSDIISFNPTMTDGKTPASGGPNLCNVGSSRVDLQACKLEYSIVSPK